MQTIIKQEKINGKTFTAIKNDGAAPWYIMGHAGFALCKTENTNTPNGSIPAELELIVKGKRSEIIDAFQKAVAAEQAVVYKAKAEREAIRHAEAKAKAKAERLAQIETRHNWAVAMRDNRSPANMPANKAAEICQEIGYTYLSEYETLQEWAEKFLVNPAYEFGWASREFVTSAKLEILAGLMAAIWDPNFDGNLLALLQGYRDQLSRQLLRNDFAQNSTSATSNAMQAAKAEAAVWFLERNRWVEQLKKAQPPQPGNAQPQAEPALNF